MNTIAITGREPGISKRTGQASGLQRLSMSRLGKFMANLAPDAVSVQAAEKMLYSDDFYVRYNAAVLLSKRSDRDARLVMEKALTEGNAPTRASVARHLHRFSWYSAEAPLRQALQDPDLRVREGAIYALCDYRMLNAYQVAAEALQNEHDDVRNAAAWSLQDCQDHDAVPVLAASMLAEDPEVRVKALEALSANDSDEAAIVVESALDDKDGNVVYNATLSLMEIRHEAAFPILFSKLRHASEQHQENILKGLSHASGYMALDLAPYAEELLSLLSVLTTSSDPASTTAATWIIVKIRSEEANEILYRMFESAEKAEVRKQIMRVAVNLMSLASAGLIERGKRDADEGVRRMAESLERSRNSGEMAQYDDSAEAANPFTKAALGRQVVPYEG